MKSSTSSNEIETPIGIFNWFLFLSLLGCQHLSLSRAEADVAVSECVETLFEKNLFHPLIVPHVFALMQNKTLLSQLISQSLNRVDAFLAVADLSWGAGCWDSPFRWADAPYARDPAKIVIRLCFLGQQTILGRNTDLKTIKSIESSFWYGLVQINTRCLDTPFKLVSDMHLAGRGGRGGAVRRAAQKIYDSRKSRNSEKQQHATQSQQGRPPKVVGFVHARAQQGLPSRVFGSRPLDFLAQAYPPALQSGEASIFSKRDFLFENGFFVRRSDIQDLLSQEEIITVRNNKNKNSAMFYVTGSENRRYYPSFFADDRYDLDVIQAVSKQLRSISGAEKWLFFVSPRVSLGGMTPLEVIEKTRSGNKNNIETEEGFRVGLSDVMSGAKSTAEA